MTLDPHRLRLATGCLTQPRSRHWPAIWRRLHPVIDRALEFTAGLAMAALAYEVWRSW